MKRKMMNFILFLIVIINAHHCTLARHTKWSHDFDNVRRQRAFEPVYPALSSATMTSVEPFTQTVEPFTQTLSETTTQHTVDNSATTEKNTVINHKSNDASTALATTSKFNWSFSNILNKVVTAYNKVTSYTGPYLLPSLLITLVVGIIGTAVCSYTMVCDSTLSTLAYNANQVSHHSSRYASLTRTYFSSRLYNYCYSAYSQVNHCNRQVGFVNH